MSVDSHHRLFPANLASSIRSAFLIAAAMVACSATRAMAQMTLTPEGQARNLQLTTFINNFVPIQTPGGMIGPFGITYEADGHVLVDTASGNLRRFNNVDNQDAQAVPILRSFGQFASSGLTTIGGNIFMGNVLTSNILQLNTNGSTNRIVAGGIAGPTGLVADPASGHIFCSTNQSPFRILDINSATGTFTTFASVAADGLTLSADRSILYAALESDHLVGYNVATGATVFDSGLISTVGGVAVGGLDGSALGYGALTGSAFVNTRGGCLVEVNLTTMAQTLIASGGSRGDFVAADPSGNGDLLLTQTDRVLRLHGIPSPSTAALLGLGGLMAARRRR